MELYLHIYSVYIRYKVATLQWVLANEYFYTVHDKQEGNSKEHVVGASVEYGLYGRP